jgi:hypothetical protein
MKLLRSKYKVVCFVAGNHEMWVERERRRSGVTSCDQLKHLDAKCQSLGVHTKPVKVSCQGSPLWLVPITSWCVDLVPRPRAHRFAHDSVRYSSHCVEMPLSSLFVVVFLRVLGRKVLLFLYPTSLYREEG